MLKINPSGQGSHQNVPAVAAAARLRCDTGPRLLPLPTSMWQHSQALLPKDPVSVRNNCISWQLRSRYLSEGAQELWMLFLRAVLVQLQAAPGLCPHPKALPPVVSLCSALP